MTWVILYIQIIVYYKMMDLVLEYLQLILREITGKCLYIAVVILYIYMYLYMTVVGNTVLTYVSTELVK